MIGLSLFLISLTAGTALVSSNIVEIGFPYLVRLVDNENRIQSHENETILSIKSTEYNKSTNELFTVLEIWTENEFSYFGNVHPFLIEIIGSEELTIINSQCFCSKDHYFPAGFSTQTTIGWIATTPKPNIPVNSDYTLPSAISIRVRLENILVSETYLVNLT